MAGAEGLRHFAQWAADGRSLYGARRFPTPAIFLLNPETGERRPWRELSMQTEERISYVVVSRGGGAYAYLNESSLSELYLVEGP